MYLLITLLNWNLSGIRPNDLSIIPLPSPCINYLSKISHLQGRFFDRVKGISVDLNGTQCDKLEVSDKIITCIVPDLLASNKVQVIVRVRR